MKPKVVTIGLGYIGLPTSALIAHNGIPVCGVDISQKVVDTINAGKIHIIEPDLAEVVAKAVESKLLVANTKPQIAETYLIVVPTPFKANFEPDISYIIKATDSIIHLLKEGDLYIIESTSPVGTTEQMRDYIYGKRPDLIEKMYFAYCPERVLPGNVLYELVNNDRVIGGVDEKSTQMAISFYKQFVKGNLHQTNAKTAEMCKLTENASRDVQIAFANEISMICDKAGIDVWELIKVANKHPRVNILQPGVGVGGHCIAVDPYFLVSNFPEESKIIAQARATNTSKTVWCLEQIKNSINSFKINNNYNPCVALMGLSFKPDIDDLRESPSMFIVEELNKDYQENLLIVEPNIKSHSSFRLTNYLEAHDSADIIIYLVKHKEFRTLVRNNSKIYLDFAGVFS